MSDLCDAISVLIKGGSLNAKSVSAILTAVTLRAKASDLTVGDIVECIEIMCRGKDGVAGTADDLIPSSTLVALRALLEHDLVADLTRGMLEGMLEGPKSWNVCGMCNHAGDVLD